MAFILAVHVLIACDDKFLLLRRSSKAKYKPGLWDLPGGKLIFGETPSGALNREVREEIGIDLGLVRLISLYSNLDNPNVQHFQAVYICNVNDFKILLKLDEHDSFEWTTLREAKRFKLLAYVTDALRTYSELMK